MSLRRVSTTHQSIQDIRGMLLPSLRISLASLCRRNNKTFCTLLANKKESRSCGGTTQHPLLTHARPGRVVTTKFLIISAFPADESAVVLIAKETVVAMAPPRSASTRDTKQSAILLQTHAPCLVAKTHQRIAHNRCTLLSTCTLSTSLCHWTRIRLYTLLQNKKEMASC